MNKEIVYFISAGLHGPIKIGKASDVKKRLQSLQTSSSEKLTILGVVSGEVGLEHRLHNKFDHGRIRGEWFARTKELLDFILKSRDEQLWPDSPLLSEPEFADSENPKYGVIQVLSDDGDSEHEGQYGYWDNDDSDLIEECGYCVGARKRNIELDEKCEDCVYEEYAVVYFGKWQDGYCCLPHEDLRVVDESVEAAKAKAVARAIFPFMTDDDHQLILDTGDPLAPIYKKLETKESKNG